jgi:chorismate mutase
MSWLDVYGRPVQISGPCSAESEEQVLQTALDLKATGKIHALRAGIWKPRTRPNSFEGVGEVGLEWLVNDHGSCERKTRRNGTESRR